jgi:cystathionine beta-lyase/cystathionine gamma-synthase
MLWFESPSNPILSVYDIKKITSICKERGVLTTFDNTIPTPLLLNPTELGVDVVLHSGTKFLGGHSDILLGFVCTNHEDLYIRMKEIYPRNQCFLNIN